MHYRIRRPRGPDPSRHGRATVITLLVVGALSQAVLSRAVGRSLWLRDPLYADKELMLRQRIASRTTAAGPPLTVVMLGSSRTGYGLCGEVAERVLAEWCGRPAVAFNFGIPAAGPVTSLVSLRRLLAAGERPDLVLIEVLPPLLTAQLDSPQEHAFLLPERLRHEEIDLVLDHGFPAEKTRSRWWVAALAPVYGQRFPLLGRIVHTWLPWNLRFDSSRGTDATGWLRSVHDFVTPDEHRRGVALAHEEYYGLLQTLRLDGPAARAVGESLALCREHGVRAAMVLMPEGTEFRDWYPPCVEEEVYDFLGDLSYTYGAPLIDARR